MASSLLSFLENNFLCDVTLKVEESTFFCHKVVLAAGSKYFYKKFEENSLDTLEVPAPVTPKFPSLSPSKVFPTVLKYLYADQRQDVLDSEALNSSTAFALFALANSLEIPSLLNFVGKFIAEEVLNDENGADVLYEGIKFGSEVLMQAAFQRVIDTFDNIASRPSGVESLVQLPFGSILEVFESSELNTSKEGKVYEVVCRYIQKRDELPEEAKEELKEEAKEELKDPLKALEITKLSDSEKLQLLQTIKWPYLSHEELLKASTNPVISIAKDLIVEGLSIQLSSLDKTNTSHSYKVSKVPRKLYQLTSETSRKKSYFEDEKEPETYQETYEEPYQEEPKPKSDGFWRSSYLHSRYSSPKPPQKQSITQLPLLKLELPIEFVYSFDFDDNGALFYLGSSGKAIPWQNPHTSGQVRAFASSISYGKIEDFVGRTVTNLRTGNEMHSYLGVDLGSGRQFLPTVYTLRNRASQAHACLNWQFEGSLDRNHWKPLDRRIHFTGNLEIDDELKPERITLKQSGATHSWAIDPEFYERKDQGFRYFRVVQLDKNASNFYNLAFSGIELYGFAIAGNWP